MKVVDYSKDDLNLKSQYPKTEVELLGLIACYFPSLIKENYHAKI